MINVILVRTLQDVQAVQITDTFFKKAITLYVGNVIIAAIVIIMALSVTNALDQESIWKWMVTEIIVAEIALQIAIRVLVDQFVLDAMMDIM